MNDALSQLSACKQRRLIACLNDDRAKLVLAYLIREQEASAGSIAKRLPALIGQVLRFPTTTIYTLLLKLEGLDLVTISRLDRTSPGRPRNFFTITPFGRSFLDTYLTRLGPVIPR